MTLLATPRQALPEADLTRQIDLYSALLRGFPYSNRVTITEMSGAEVVASNVDDRIGRYRRLVINESGQVTKDLAQWRADWEREHRISKALELTYKVQGWRQSNGALWVPNQTVRVRDPLVGLDRDMLIAELTYQEDRSSGRICTMKVAPPDGFEPEPNDKRKRMKLKKSKSKDGFEYLLPSDWEKN